MRLLPAAPERCDIPYALAATRVVASLLRRQVPALRAPKVRLDRFGFRILADLGTPFGLRMYRYGLCDADVALTQRLLAPGDVFVDGGAHLGTFALAAAVAVGSTGRVVACEPDPVTAAGLRANVSLNDFTCISVHETALSDQDGAATFRTIGTASGVGSLSRPGGGEAAPAAAAGHPTAEIAVTTATLDGLLGDDCGRVRLVKLDVEGSEVHALRGATGVLASGVADFIIEVEPEHLARQGSTVAELEALLTDAGYAAYRLHHDGRGQFAFEPVAPPWRRPVGGPNLFFSAHPPDERQPRR